MGFQSFLDVSPARIDRCRAGETHGICGFAQRIIPDAARDDVQLPAAVGIQNIWCPRRSCRNDPDACVSHLLVAEQYCLPGAVNPAGPLCA
ncbi:hypothetical protein G6F60_014587 [Rhizopus arrhizus]|nr:hypothetical protein G6F40_017129 [Rhizopus arrhizus]KAG1386139.1 hypothetical protein G6F60_014587 [Rhizopus arrhizus]